MENKKNIIDKMKELNSLMEDFLDRMDMDECENSDEERMDFRPHLDDSGQILHGHGRRRQLL